MVQHSTTSASSSQAIIACQGLSKVFKDFWMRSRVRAVENLTFNIMPHEVFGLLGPNGSGKSTTIKVLLGLLNKTSGRVAVFGKPPSDVAVKRHIGYLPEESYLYPFLNARETLDYYGKLFELDRSTRKKRIDELLDMVGLSAVQHRQVHEYSKGMQRRIGLAQALINDPDLLILDEPTTGLDPIGTRQVKDLICELGRRGKTVLLSSHILSDVEDVVDRMVILYGGKKRAEGTCDDLLISRSRTTIEVDRLDDETLSQIDQLIRKRTAGHSSVISVSHPRQKLEELFLDIVEKAKAERLDTAGATNDGQTAAFLRSEQDEQEDAEQLISRLMLDEPVQQVAEPEQETAKPIQTQMDDQPDESLIQSLAQDDEQPVGGSVDVGAVQDSEGAEKAEQSSPVGPSSRSSADRKKDAGTADSEIDLDVIGSLLDEPEDTEEQSP